MTSPVLTARGATRSAHSGAIVHVVFACSAMLVSYLPFSTVNGALGTIRVATNASTSDVQWLTDAFALALAASVLPAGGFAERFGRRRIVLVGLLCTALGSTIAALAGLLPDAAAIRVLWGALAVAGLGGGAVMTASLALVAATAPDATARRRSIAAWAASVTLGLGTGPFIATAVPASWSTAFAPIAALAAVVAIAGLRLDDEPRGGTARVQDRAGQIASIVAVGALVFGTIHLGSAGWDVVTIASFALAVIAASVFIAVERRSSAPTVPLSLFRSRGFTAAGLAAAAVLFSVVGSVFVASLFLSHQGGSATQIAVRLGVLFAANVLTSLGAAWLQARIGGRRVLVLGLLVAAVGAWTLSGVESLGLADWAWRLALLGAGAGLVMATASTLAVAETEPALAARAGAANNGIRQLGAALSASVVGSVLSAALATGADWPTAVHLCLTLLAALLGATAIGCAALLRRPRS